MTKYRVYVQEVSYRLYEIDLDTNEEAQAYDIFYELGSDEIKPFFVWEDGSYEIDCIEKMERADA